MLSRKRQALAEQIGAAVAHDLFISMLNPKFRGAGFKWSRLEDLSVRLAKSHVELAGTFGRDARAMLEQAALSARHVVKRCLKESDIEAWLPDIQRPIVVGSTWRGRNDGLEREVTAIEDGGLSYVRPCDGSHHFCDLAKWYTDFEWQSDPPAIFLASNGVVLGPGTYEVVEIPSWDPMPKIGVGHRFVVGKGKRLVPFNAGFGMRWGVDGTIVTAVRRIENDKVSRDTPMILHAEGVTLSRGDYVVLGVLESDPASEEQIGVHFTLDTELEPKGTRYPHWYVVVNGKWTMVTIVQRA